MGHKFAYKTNGQTWCWGANDHGQLGNNEVLPHRSSPVQVIGNHSFISIALGRNHSLGLKQNGSVWSWGANFEGQLGDNTIEHKSSPILVLGEHSFVKICDTGADFSCAINSNGSIWSWGPNGNGQLGDNSRTNRSSPVIVVGNHNFVMMRAGQRHCVALKSNGEVWTWGYNGWGQLAHGSSGDRSSPVLVIGNHSFIQVSGLLNSCACLKLNGNVWAWGNNDSGQLGDNTTQWNNSPVLVVGEHSFIKIASGNSHVLALKSNGSVWAWGLNNYGQLGDNSTTNRSSPVLISGDHYFIDVCCSFEQAASFGLKPDGTMWSWGYNAYGTLGTGNISSRSSPVAVIGDHSFLSFGEGTPAKVYVNGSWKRHPFVFVNVDGTWKRMANFKVKVSGEWKATI